MPFMTSATPQQSHLEGWFADTLTTQDFNAASYSDGFGDSSLSLPPPRLFRSHPPRPRTWHAHSGHFL